MIEPHRSSLKSEQMSEVRLRRSRATRPPSGTGLPKAARHLVVHGVMSRTRPGRPHPAARDAESRNDPLLPAPASLRTLVF